MIEVLKQARNAFVWNLNTDLDNIPACEKWSKMLRKNIDDLNEAISKATHPPQRTWVGLTRIELIKCGVLPFGMSYELCQAIEAKLKEKNFV